MINDEKKYDLYKVGQKKRSFKKFNCVHSTLFRKISKPLFVWLCIINVKAAEHIGPILFISSHDPREGRNFASTKFLFSKLWNLFLYFHRNIVAGKIIFID